MGSWDYLIKVLALLRGNYTPASTQLAELCRVSKEVIFPLLDVDGNRSPYVDPAIDFLRAGKRDVTEVKVAYEFQKGGNTMLKIC